MFVTKFTVSFIASMPSETAFAISAISERSPKSGNKDVIPADKIL